MRRDESQLIPLLFDREGAVLVAGLQPFRLRQNPYLQQVRRLLGLIDLAMHDTGTGRHALHFVLLDSSSRPASLPSPGITARSLSRARRGGETARARWSAA